MTKQPSEVNVCRVKCQIGFMMAYIIFYPVAYFILGIYLIYDSTISDGYHNLMMWISYLGQPFGLLHPLGIGTSEKGTTENIMFIVYFLGAILFWFCHSKINNVTFDTEFIKNIVGFSLLFNIFLLLTCQIFYSLKFGNCVYTFENLSEGCPSDSDCINLRNNAGAAYFFMLITCFTIIPVNKYIEQIESSNVTCGGHINELKNFAYFSSAFGGIIMLILITLIVAAIALMIYVEIRNGWDAIKELHASEDTQAIKENTRVISVETNNVIIDSV